MLDFSSTVTTVSQLYLSFFLAASFRYPTFLREGAFDEDECC